MISFPTVSSRLSKLLIIHEMHFQLNFKNPTFTKLSRGFNFRIPGQLDWCFSTEERFVCSTQEMTFTSHVNKGT